MNSSGSRNQFGVVLVTVASKEEAIAIAHALVESKLAACVSILPIQSIYSWQDTIHQADEWQLLIKSNLSKFTELEAKIRELHSYEVPEIIAMSIVAGSLPYLQWIEQSIANNE